MNAAAASNTSPSAITQFMANSKPLEFCWEIALAFSKSVALAAVARVWSLT